MWSAWRLAETHRWDSDAGGPTGSWRWLYSRLPWPLSLCSRTAPLHPSGVGPHLAKTCLFGMMAYMGAMAIGSRVAARQVEAWLTERGDVGTMVRAGPVPVNHLIRKIIVFDDSHYHFIELN